MIQPPYLKNGDTIGLVAPASHVTEEELSMGIELISSLGFKILKGKYLFARQNSFAGNDDQRAEDFRAMIDNPEVKAILCARGGYGSLRMADKLDLSDFMRHPKWIAGCSDITVLHALMQHMGIESLHAAMPRNMTRGKADAVSLMSLKESLTGSPVSHTVPPHANNRRGHASGILVGGNLSVIYSLRGTAWDIDTRDRILFIEDLNEYLYHIDRMMTNLLLGGKLQPLKGLIVGGMTGMKASASGFRRSACNIIRDAAESFDFPVMFSVPSGHIKPNKALILGRKLEMEVGDTGGILRFGQ